MQKQPINLSQAIHSILNDVIEQCFRQLMRQPDQRPYIESIIDRATNDILSLDKQTKEPHSIMGYASAESQHEAITKLLHKRSLLYLRELQKIQEAANEYH